MKTLYSLIFILALSIGMQGLQAKIITVNNSEGQPADFKLLQEAINAAVDGDSIYVVGSPTDYGTISINDKRLVLIGPGYFLGENEDIKTQASNETAKISRLTIVGEKASNTVISGIDNGLGTNFITIDDGNDQGKPQNVVLLRNKINNINVNFAESTLIKENFIDNVILNRGASNSIIWNNIIIGRIQESGISGGLSGTNIKNNTLNDGLNGVDNAKVENNIFIAGGLEGTSNNTVQNNVFTVTESEAFPEDPNSNTYKDMGNKFGQPATSLFVSSEREIDSDFQLAEGSPAKGAGIDGVDAGAFTTDENSYKISGLPAIPSIYELTTNGVGTPETGMKVTIKAKSNL